MDVLIRATRAERATAAWLKSLPFFDAEFYLAQVDDPAAAANPALHYLLLGEAAGVMASPVFSGADYLALNPDLRGIGQSLIIHYALHGRAEGRRCAYESDTLLLDDQRVDPGKPTVLLLLDAAGADDASLAGWTLARELKLTRNVVVVLRRGGALIPLLEADANAFIALPTAYVDDPVQIGRLAGRLKARYAPIYAVAHGIATRVLGVAAKEAGVPVIAMVNEFADEAPPYALAPLYRACDILAFASEGARRSSLHRREYRLLAQRTTVLLRQGAPEPPPPQAVAPSRPTGTDTPSLTGAPGARPFTVLGAGSVDLTAGVDLFVSTAVAMRAQAPELAFRFIWLGEGAEPPDTFACLLDEQLARSGLDSGMLMIGGPADRNAALATADAFLLSSRRDAPAFAAVTAALSGLPVVCFEEASGLSEVLGTASRTGRLIAPYLDTGAVAERLVELAKDPLQRHAAGRACQKMVRQTFSSVRHAAALDALGHTLAARRSAREAQVSGLEPDHAFDPGLYFGSQQEAPKSRVAAVRRYLEDTLNVDWTGPAVESHHPRRPLPGFNPFIYAHQSPDFDIKAGVDPLVDYIRKGCPRGAWSHDVIALAPDTPVAEASTGLRVALHGHFHYTESFGDFLDALDANRHPMDLFITTTMKTAAEMLQTQAEERYSNGQVRVMVGTNLGRDVGPFLALLDEQLDVYDIVGHMHGKRSSHGQQHDPGFGDRWRHFLWQHLLGPAAPVADVVLTHFAADQELGLVFPENEHLVGWEQNLGIAEKLAPRLGLSSLPEHLEFPVGTMFWARTSALRLLKEARFTQADYQAEPLPLDGTLLHALERLITLVVDAEGFRYATTRFPRFSR